MVVVVGVPLPMMMMMMMIHDRRWTHPRKMLLVLVVVLERWRIQSYRILLSLPSCAQRVVGVFCGCCS